MTAHYIITMPQLSDTMTEGVVVSWEKKPGDAIARADIVATVETDKAIMDVEVFADGFLAGPLAEVGSTVAVGEPLGYLTNTPGDVRIGSNEVVTQSVQADMVPHDAGVPIMMPQLSDTMTEGAVVSWEKKAGDEIMRGDIVATVETDKAIMDVEVFADGYLSGPLAAPESVVQVGHAMGFIVQDKNKVINKEVRLGEGHKVIERASASATVTSSAQAQAHIPQTMTPPARRPDHRQVSPYARKLAALKGVDLGHLSATGPDGVIVAADVLHAQPSMAEVAHHLPQVQVPGQGRAMTAMEKSVAHSMTAALTLPTFYVTVHVRPEALAAAAKARKISLTVAIAKACSLAMQKHPMMNNTYQPIDRIVERGNHDFGVAVAAEGGGLVVPILHNIEQKELDTLQAEWSELVPRARHRKLSPYDYANPTFTISNMGMFGVSHFTAIPTPGIAAILAISATGPEGMPLTITADHRVLNGAHVAAYLADLKQVIEHPETWVERPGPVIPEGAWDYQVAILGGGPGGEDCARDLASHGIKVVIINKDPLPGGECLWRGCIPSKAWRMTADRIRDRAHDETLGITNTGQPKFNWTTVEARRKEVMKIRGELALKTDKSLKVDVRQGTASFIDTHTLQVVPLEGEPYQLKFGAAVIATGAPPFVPPSLGTGDLQAKGILTSDTVWSLANAPKRLAIVGAGAIGIEMAQIMRDFGVEVILVEAKDRPLMEVDEEIARNLSQVLSQEPGIKFYTEAKIAEISGKPGKVTIKFSDSESKSYEEKVDYVLAATGKRPDTSALNLAAAGVALDGAAIKVDQTCRTNIAHIYAVGDVVGGFMLAHTAATQGRIAAANLLGENTQYNQNLDCGVIFSRPQAGFVGLTLAQAKAQGVDAAEVKMPISIDAKAMITLETQGMIKLVADKQSQKIIGVHFLADHTDALIGEAVLMVSSGLTLKQVAEAIHPHPTQTELFGELARKLLTRLRRSEKKSMGVTH